MPTARIMVLICLAIAFQVLGNLIGLAYARQDLPTALQAVMGAIGVFVIGMVMVYPFTLMLFIGMSTSIAGFIAMWLTFRVKKSGP